MSYIESSSISEKKVNEYSFFTFKIRNIFLETQL